MHEIRIPVNFPIGYFQEIWKVYRKDNQINRMDALFVILNEFSRKGLINCYVDGLELNNEALRKVCGYSFDEVKKDLLELDNGSIFFTDGSYAVGIRSKKYRISFKYCFDELVNVDLCSEQKYEKYLAFLNGQRKYKTKFPPPPSTSHLEEQFKGLNLELIPSVHQYKDLYITFFRNKIEKCRNKKIKFLYYYKIGYLLESIDRIKKNIFNTSLSKSNYRFNSIFTNMKKELRYFLRVENCEFIELDISASHPYILATILTNDFFNEKNGEYSISHIFHQLNKMIENYDDANKNIELKKVNNTINKIKETQAGAGQREFPHLSSSYFQNQDIIEYRSLDFESDFYKEIQKQLLEFESSNPTAYINRDKIKKLIMVWLNLSEPGERVKIKNIKLLQQLFPSIDKLVQSIGFFQDMKTAIALLLQRAESHLVLDVVAKYLIEKLPQIRIFTIHDSFLIQNKNLDIDETIHQIKDTLEKHTGIRPGIKQKLLNPFTSFDEIVKKDINSVKRMAYKTEKKIYLEEERTFSPSIISTIKAGIFGSNSKSSIEKEVNELTCMLQSTYKD
jgi:hypothetical protein